MSKQMYTCSIALSIEAESHEEAAAVFDAWVKDPNGRWMYRIRNDETKEARIIDNHGIDFAEHYPD